MNIIEQMLSKYNIETENDIVNALKEIFQEITLLGLYRGNFFNKAAFYGGTSLRILYGLNRFSENWIFRY
jgi:conjugal transfer pilus assembly protein TraW